MEMTHVIREHGNGFPSEGELVYSSEENGVYRVLAIGADTPSRQYEAAGAYVALQWECDPTGMTDEEFEEMRDARVEPIDLELISSMPHLGVLGHGAAPEEAR